MGREGSVVRPLELRGRPGLFTRFLSLKFSMGVDRNFLHPECMNGAALGNECPRMVSYAGLVVRERSVTVPGAPGTPVSGERRRLADMGVLTGAGGPGRVGPGSWRSGAPP